MTKDMTQGTPWKQICAFALPVLLSQVFQQLYNTADALIVGRLLGDDALAAVSSSNALIMFLVSFFTGTAMGAGIVISRFFGAGDSERVSKAIHTIVLVAVICGGILTAIGTVFAGTFMTWMGTAPEVLEDATAYFRFYFLGVMAVVLYNGCKSILNALGDSRRPLYYLILSSLTNILLDYVFIGIFRWGVWSAALATTLSQGLSAVLCLVHLRKPGAIYHLEWKKLRIDRQMLGLIFRYGIPAGVQNSVIGFANTIVQSYVNSFGKYAMAAYGAYTRMEGFALMAVSSFTTALTTFVSQNLGAKKNQRARAGSRFGILCAMAISGLLGVLLYFFTPQLLRLFTDTPEVIAIGVQQSKIVSPFLWLLAMSHAISAVLRGAGRVMLPMGVMMGCWCALRVAYVSVVLHFVHEIQYLYWGYPLSWIVGGSIFLLYYLFSDWSSGFDTVKKTNRG